MKGTAKCRIWGGVGVGVTQGAPEN